MNEVWKDIVGYEGYYQVSNLGRVKSFGNTKIPNKYTGKERLLKSVKHTTDYLQITLFKNGKGKQFSVHRLVALTFLDNPNNYPCVNHKDENKQNNCVDNLEWCTYKYNNDYGSRKLKVSLSYKNNQKNSTPIKCIDLKTNEIKFYPSMAETERQLNLKKSAVRGSICNKGNKPYKNRYIFTKI